MPVVVDANLLVALISGDPRSEAVSRLLETWIESGIDLHAPALARYEVSNALTRLIVAGKFPQAGLSEAWAGLESLPLIYQPLDEPSRTIEIALLLGRQNAYDAAYLALAERLKAELDSGWTPVPQCS